MKIQKFNENVDISTNSIKKTIIDYHELLIKLKPLVIERYLEISKDDDLMQEIVDVYGSDYFSSSNAKKLILTDIKYFDNKIFFTLKHNDIYGSEDKYYYVPFNEDELDDAILKMNAHKYNL
jgi:hypothetical protein